MFPELTNNDYRGGTTESPKTILIPPGYIDRLEISEDAQFMYLSSNDAYLDYQGDEMWIKKSYDITVTTPPIPEGTYEVRLGYQPTGARGVIQFYLNGMPIGIPLDMRMDADHAKIGYEVPGSNSEDPYGYENDKMMRNRGFMKGPASFKAGNSNLYGGKVARRSEEHTSELKQHSEISHDVFCLRKKIDK